MSATLTEPSRHGHPVMDGLPGILTPSGDSKDSGSDFHAHLQRFVVAKSQIISIYKEMSTYVTDVNRYVFDLL